ncbi:MAG: hypothetical protein WAM05_15635 [Candidatus Binataceae bacterium]
MGSQSFDLSRLPKSMRENLRDTQPNTASWTPELKALLDPNIEVRRLATPLANSLKIINNEYVYYYARRLRGSNPDANNYLRLKLSGYQNATCDPKCTDETGDCQCDVHPLVSEINSDGTEITLGPDLVLVKARPEVHYGRMKAYAQRAINMTNPNRGEYQEQMGRVMKSEDHRTMDVTRTRNVEQGSELDEAISGKPNWRAIVDQKETKGKK